jgi:RNA-directed DNA polymerase
MRVTNPSSYEHKPIHEGGGLIERMVEGQNMKLAYEHVFSNKGSSGVDKMEVDELKGYLQIHWQAIKAALLEGTYKPRGVRQVMIPKPGGGERQLGIPTVLDRMIQQAMHQVLNPLFDPTFSTNSYGFRKGKSAHQAVEQARKYQLEGRRWVVDMDLAKFFDEVNHDKLMGRIRKSVQDKAMLKLIRSYLRTGIMLGGLAEVREKGTPQGSPLSPLLSNIVLDELDKELERRGHKFCRYADDCNIYVKSEKAGARVMGSVTGFIERKLKLKVNREKSAVAKPSQRTFLGYSFTYHKEVKIRVPKETVQRLRGKLKEIFRKARGRNIGRVIKEELTPLLRGWINYFKLAETKLFAEELDSWVRRRLRLMLWKQWKRPWTRMKNLMKAGIKEERAATSGFNQRGSWFNSGASHMNEAFPKKYFDKCGLVSMLDQLLKLRIC